MPLAPDRGRRREQPAHNGAGVRAPDGGVSGRRHPDVYRQQIQIDTRLGWSLGWGTAGDILWQWGYHVAFNAFAAIVPARGVGIVLLTNGVKGQRINREWVNAWLETDLPAFYQKGIEL